MDGKPSESIDVIDTFFRNNLTLFILKVGDHMQCERCLNQDPSYFFVGQTITRCRRCIHLGGMEVESLPEIQQLEQYSALPFELSQQQKMASKIIAEKGLSEDVLVEAVCGAGKTELVIELIDKALSQNKHVGWMIARRQVVLQLQKRLSTIFENQKVIAVCEGHTTELEGHLILLTAHQLYRYPKRFDILIIDEPDAFPYKGNALLHDLAQVACKSFQIYLTATPDETLNNKEIARVQLHRRPHGRDLIVPKVRMCFKATQLMWLIYYLWCFKSERVLIFCPTIRQCENYARYFRCDALTSQSQNSQEILERFESKQSNLLFTTTVLERGMTFDEVFVIVMDAHHRVFDEASLVQISGRVGRSFTKEKGECIFITNQKSEAIDSCIKRLINHNNA